MEQDELLSASINNSNFIHVDTTDSRDDRKNSYCTIIGTASFTRFSST